MKSPAEFIIGFLFTVTSMLFWYGGYAILFTEQFIKRYWWAVIVVGVMLYAAYTVGRSA